MTNTMSDSDLIVSELTKRFTGAAGELDVLSEKPISGVNCVDLCHIGGGENARYAQIGLGARRWTDAHSLICKLHMQRLRIGRGMHSDGANTHLLAGADDPKGDLSTIRHKHLRKRGASGRSGTS